MRGRRCARISAWRCPLHDGIVRRYRASTGTAADRTLARSRRGALGIATFFDGFDALAIAFVMPVLVRLWSLSPVETGLLIGVGRAIGALLFARIADRRGRVVAIR